MSIYTVKIYYLQTDGYGFNRYDLIYLWKIPRNCNYVTWKKDKTQNSSNPSFIVTNLLVTYYKIMTLIGKRQKEVWQKDKEKFWGPWGFWYVRTATTEKSEPNRKLLSPSTIYDLGSKFLL